MPDLPPHKAGPTTVTSPVGPPSKSAGPTRTVDESRVARRWDLLLWTAILAAGVLGVGLILWATKWGPGAYSDSVAYLVSARNVVRGIGLGIHTGSGRFQVLTHFPPLYPLSLAILDRLSFPELTAARVVNVALGAGVLLIPAWILMRTLRRPFLSLLWIALMAANPFVFHQFAFASSEPLAFFLGFSGLFLLVIYPQHPTRAVMVASALATGLAALARYHAVAFVVAGVLVAPFVLPKDARGRVRDMVLYGLAAAAPIAIWLAYIRLGVAAAPPRLWATLPDNLWAALQPWRGTLVQTIWGWTGLASQGLLESYRVKGMILVGLSALAGVAWLWSLRRPSLGLHGRSIRVGLSVAVVFALAHVGVLAFAWVATLPRPDAGDRILLPLLPAGIAFLIFLVDSAAELGRTGRALRTMILAGAAVALATWLPVTVRLAAQLHAEGEGYTSVQWRSSPTLQAVLEIPLDVPIISNEASPILFYADHPAYEITELNQQQRLAGYPRYGEGPGDRAQRAFREEGGRLVLFHSAYWNFYPIYEADTSARLEALVDGLDVLGSYADGDIYSYPSSEGATTSLAVKPATSAWAAGGDDCVLHSYLGERRGGESERRSWTPSPAQCEGRQGRTHAE